METLTDKQKLEVLSRSVKVLQGECNRCGGELYEMGSTKKFIRCPKCEKTQGGDTFGEAYVMFFIAN